MWRLWRIVVFTITITIGEMEFLRIQFPTLDCRGCVALYHRLISMDEDEDDGLFISGFGNRNAKRQTVSREDIKETRFLFFAWYVVYVDVHVEVGTRCTRYINV